MPKNDIPQNVTNDQYTKVAVVMLPLPAQGHLNQLLHLSRLVASHDIPVYYAATPTFIRQAKLRTHDLSVIAKIKFHEFPETPFQNPPPNPNSSIKFPSQIMPSLFASTNLRQPVYAFVDELSRSFRRVVVVYDSLMAYVVQDLDSIQNAELYSFRSISAISVCAFEREEEEGSYSTYEEQILKEIPSMDGHYPPEFGEFLHLQTRAREIFSGEIYNSCEEIESLFLDMLARRERNKEKKIWAIGPFHPVIVKQDFGVRHECLDWLDNQEPNSVIFISFGSTCSFCDEQVKEIAFGLERSECKFIWVLRDADKGNIFYGEVKNPELPEGFEKRVKERGIVVRDWAPQLEILGHGSIGGFMSHCGWNSCLESISMGVPIATWPMHSDQPANATLITKVLRIGVEVRNWACRDELVSSVTVENVVRKLMGSEEGYEIRKRANELGNVVKKSLMEGGNTRKEMKSFITRITR